MKLNEVLPWFIAGAYIRRQSDPTGDRYMIDGAEEGTIWRYSAENDDLIKDQMFGFVEIVADDWEIVF